tara:strand:- start:8395 stop:9015 length:621 start_codon:yes stop_codon:yes gene_type:complete
MSKEIVQNDYDIKIMQVDDIKPYQNNPRQINQNSIDQVKKSIQQNSFSNVIVVDKNNEIIAGHTRLEAAKQLNMTELPVFVAKKLDDNAVKRLRLLDNRLTELTAWDLEKLVEETTQIELDADVEALFEPLLKQDLSEFDLSDDGYEPQEENYSNAIIQYVMIFDNEDQQDLWYNFLGRLREDFPKHETHASRIAEYIKKLNIPIK